MPGDELLGRLTGERLRATERYGKMLALQFESHLALVIHLMLIGRIALYQGELARPSNPLLRLRFEADQSLEVRFVAARSLALLPGDRSSEHPLIAKQGPDALAITPAQFSAALGKARGPVKSVFMDQTLIAGVGNAYADEILFEARVHPLAPITSLGDNRIAALHTAIPLVLQRAIDLGAAEEYVLDLGLEAGLTRKQDLMRVHNRAGQPCPECGGRVGKIELSGRRAYFCSRCQEK